MSAIRTKHESRTILDLSNSKRLSKYQAYKLLRATEFHERIGQSYIDYNIKIGMYVINLHLISTKFDAPAKYLKDYGNFYISIHEVNVRGKYSSINLNRDIRFVGQNWLQPNNNYNLRAYHLADVIIHCQRLNALKAFL